MTRNNQLLKLSPTAWQLLETLLRASPNPVSRNDLEHAIWGDEVPDSNSLKVHLFNLRKTIDSGSTVALIHTIVGFGFALRETP